MIGPCDIAINYPPLLQTAFVYWQSLGPSVPRESYNLMTIKMTTCFIGSHGVCPGLMRLGILIALSNSLQSMPHIFRYSRDNHVACMVSSFLSLPCMSSMSNEQSLEPPEYPFYHRQNACV